MDKKGNMMDSSNKLNRYLAHLSEGRGCYDRHEGFSGCCTGVTVRIKT